jgi:hypothetical protein
MLRRASALLAVVAVAAAPAVASTRLFCRYTGVEIAGCDELDIPAQALYRAAGCCERRTVHALDEMRPGADDRLQPAPLLAGVVALAIPQGRPTGRATRGCSETVAAAAGPPAFLSHRALLI